MCGFIRFLFTSFAPFFSVVCIIVNHNRHIHTAFWPISFYTTHFHVIHTIYNLLNLCQIAVFIFAIANWLRLSASLFRHSISHTYSHSFSYILAQTKITSNFSRPHFFYNAFQRLPVYAFSLYNTQHVHARVCSQSMHKIIRTFHQFFTSTHYMWSNGINNFYSLAFCVLGARCEAVFLLVACI